MGLQLLEMAFLVPGLLYFCSLDINFSSDKNATIRSSGISAPKLTFFNGPFLASFYSFIFVFATNSWHKLNSKNFADVGIRSADLWCWRQPLCQLRHNHGPILVKTYFSIKLILTRRTISSLWCSINGVKYLESIWNCRQHSEIFQQNMKSSTFLIL